MRRLSSRAVLLLLGAAFLAVPGRATAQLHVLFGAGLSNPSGDFADRVDSGYHGRVGLEAGAPLFPLSFRAEGDYNRFPGATTHSSGHATVLSGSASAVLSLGGVGISPYVLAGFGAYRTSFTDDFVLGDPTTDTGYHVGFGVAVGLLGVGGFLEARFVSVSAEGGSRRYIPVTLAIRL